MSLTMPWPATVKLTYTGQVNRVTNSMSQHCAVWMYLDDTLINDHGGYGAGFVMLNSEDTDAWWERGDFADMTTVEPGVHIIGFSADGDIEVGRTFDCAPEVRLRSRPANPRWGTL